MISWWRLDHYTMCSTDHGSSTHHMILSVFPVWVASTTMWVKTKQWLYTGTSNRQRSTKKTGQIVADCHQNCPPQDYPPCKLSWGGSHQNCWPRRRCFWQRSTKKAKERLWLERQSNVQSFFIDFMVKVQNLKGLVASKVSNQQKI